MLLVIRNADQLNALEVALSDYMDETKAATLEKFPHRDEMLTEAMNLYYQVNDFKRRLREYTEASPKPQCMCPNTMQRHTLCPVPHDLFDGGFRLKAVKQ